MFKKVKVRMTENGIVANDQVTRKDQVHLVDPDTAARLVATGKAVGSGVRVRVVRAGLFGTVCRPLGDEFEVGEEEAIALHANGRALVVDPRSVSATLPTPKEYPEKTAPKPGPFDGEPLVSIRVLRHFFADRTGYSPGDKVSIPETLAARAIAAG